MGIAHGPLPTFAAPVWAGLCCLAAWSPQTRAAIARAAWLVGLALAPLLLLLPWLVLDLPVPVLGGGVGGGAGAGAEGAALPLLSVHLGGGQ